MPADRPLLYSGDNYKPPEKPKEGLDLLAFPQIILTAAFFGSILYGSAMLLDKISPQNTAQVTRSTANQPYRLPEGFGPSIFPQLDGIIPPPRTGEGENLLEIYNSQFQRGLLGWSGQNIEDLKHAGVEQEGFYQPLYLETYKSKDGAIVVPALIYASSNPIQISPNSNYQVEFDVKTVEPGPNLNPEVRVLYFSNRGELIGGTALRVKPENTNWKRAIAQIGPDSEALIPQNAAAIVIGLSASLDDKSDSAIGTRVLFDNVNFRGIPRKQSLVPQKA